MKLPKRKTRTQSCLANCKKKHNEDYGEELDMKKVNKITLFAVILIIESVGCSQVVDPNYEVGTWQGFRLAAVSYTFDDGCSNQYAIAIPMFNEFDFDLTMYPVINWSPNWAALQEAAAEGHEIGSHTMSHPYLNQLTIEQQAAELENSQKTINSNIEGDQCITIAYPYCVPSNLTLTQQYYIAARHCQGNIERTTPSNFYQISSIICGSQGAIRTPEDFNTKFERTATSNGWCVLLFHGIDNDGGYSPVPSTTLRASLEFLDAHRDVFWVSTFSNVVRYIKERNDVSVMELSCEDTSIVLQVTDTLDDAIYNYPVTIRRPLPGNWSSANVSQNEQAVDVSVVEIDSIKYVMFDVVPDRGDVVLIKAPAPPTGLTATADDELIMLDWDDNSESDLSGYNVYRSVTSDGDFSKLNDLLLSSSDYTDVNVPQDTTCYYVVTAVDIDGIESGCSNEVFGLCQTPDDETGN
ncbi:MAG: polysaccharide deacetylase family protein [Phycisphaerales bacterium]|jgi:oligosaccharide reducing-end xylanase